MTLSASVVVRAMNKADTITRTLERLRGQTVRPEIIVVDSGSTDGTLEIARRLADRVLEIPSSSFTYGGALNLGAEAAQGEIHMAVSAHSYPYSPSWVEDSLALYRRDDVAGTNSGRRNPAGDDIVGAYHQTPRDAVEHPWWGFSNHGSSWRGSAWQQHRFREDLPAAEDKEWSWRVLAAGWTVAYSPRLSVSANHRRNAGFVPLFRRIVKERGTMLGMGVAPPRTAREAFLAWWDPERLPESRHPMVRRLSPWRAVENAAACWVERRPLVRYDNPGLDELRRQLREPPPSLAARDARQDVTVQQDIELT